MAIAYFLDAMHSSTATVLYQDFFIKRKLIVLNWLIILYKEIFGNIFTIYSKVGGSSLSCKLTKSAISLL